METSLDTLSTGDLRILQPRMGYRYSLDALILTFFMTLRARASAIELGAGTGIIALVLAKRFPDCRIAAVEIQQPLYDLLVRNIALNGLRERIEPQLGDVREIDRWYGPASFDTVCANPPYRKVRSGRSNPDREKALARHEICLSLDELVRAAAYLLAKRGRFFLIHRPERLADLVQKLRRCNLEPKRMRTVHAFATSAPSSVLLEAVKGARPGMTMEGPFVIYRDRSKEYSEEMMQIYAFRAPAGGV